jgi:3'-phosphoadenosine 5'-phosphosulfate sulfotransferase (PAPS reductase)/FAD synthetase
MTTRTTSGSATRPTIHPTYRFLSLCAGVQSSALLLLAATGRIRGFDAAIFADTGWEPLAVYRHLNRLTRIADAAGIPVVRVSRGHIRRDALDPAHRFASMPLYTLGPAGERGMTRRQCTSEYKIRPIKAEVRRRLGYPHPKRVPPWVHAEISIGISVDEVMRARDSDVRYMRNTFPLLDLGWRREDCLRFLARQGLPDTPKSSCLGCPYHDDRFWARLKENNPLEWADAVAFDEAIRHGSARANADGHPLRGTFYLHPSRVPLAEAVLRPRPEGSRGGDSPGCGPWTCPRTPPVDEQPTDETPVGGEPASPHADQDGTRRPAVHAAGVGVRGVA